MNWYLKVLYNYADFSGRARRKEFWYFTLFHFIIIITLVFLGAYNDFNRLYEAFDTTSAILILYALATLIPNLAVTVRRLHDTGKSGLWYLISFIPYIGWFILLILVCFDSERGVNKWGPNPKGIGNSDAIDQIGTE